jgi:lipid-binding SYLF domain-containing protein
MKNPRFIPALAAALSVALLTALPAQSAEKKEPTPAEARAQLAKDVKSTIAAFKKADPGIDRFFKQSAGYVVFPDIGKVGLIVAVGDAQGEVYEKGKVIGTASMSFGTVGLQAGAQVYSQIIFFQEAAAIDRFKQNKFEFTANASAVIVKAGAAKAAEYRDGVAVFTHTKGGAMVEAALGTQKFKFTGAQAAAKKK